MIPSVPEQPDKSPEKVEEKKDQHSLITEASAQKASGKTAKKLSPEEQMALYEEDLKESDWGHQPC